MTEFSVKIERQHAHFCSGHFLIFPDGSSEPLHGHNYEVEVEVHGGLGKGGLVVDFLTLMPIVKDQCARLDSRTILPTRNRWLKVAKKGASIEARLGRKRYLFPASDVVLLPIENSSCELLARHVCLGVIEGLRREGMTLNLGQVKVSIEEAPGQMATCLEAVAS